MVQLFGVDDAWTDIIEVIDSVSVCVYDTWISLSFIEHTISLKKGDRIYMTSDGYYDQFGGENDKKFTKKRFTQMLTEFQDMALIDQEMEIKTKFQDWKGRTEQVDDILVIGLEI